MHGLILGVFFVSGLCALIYEVVWARQLILVFGVTTLSVSTVLTVFMGGLALGSWGGGRVADRVANPLKTYVALEAGIALWAALLLVVFPCLPKLYGPVVHLIGGGYGTTVVLRFLFSAALLLIPTALMGATLPVLGRYVVESFEHLGKRMGVLYTANTLGGVMGSFLTGFFLLNLLGARISTVLAALTNLALALFALWLARRIPSHGTEEWHETEKGKPEREIRVPAVIVPKPAVLLVFGISGFAALAYEVLWTRILIFVLGTHTYAFTTLLMAFLMGIALGSVAFSWVADRTERPVFLLFSVQVVIGLSALLLTLIFRRIPVWFAQWATMGGGVWWKFAALEFLVCFLLMLIPAFCMGGTFPLAMKLYVSDLEKRGEQIGRTYMVNTVGAILGAFVSGFVFIQWLGIGKSIAFFAASNIAGAIALVWLARSVRVLPRLAATCTVLGLFLLFSWKAPLATRLQQLGPEERLLFYEESASATVAVKETAKVNGLKVLTVNGLEEVPLDYVSMQTFRFLGHFPLLIHPNPHSVLVVSFGAGIATGSASLHESVEIEAVEICGAVPRAARLFSRENHRVLENPRVRIVLQDGRNYIATGRKTYDVITADATHPWSADSWILYTREFYELCKSRLNPGGIMIQWLPLHWLSPRDYRSLLRTFKLVFPHTSLWFTNSYTIMVATQEKLAIDFSRLLERLSQRTIRKDLDEVSMGNIYSLLGFFMMGEDQIDRYVAGGEINTDDRPMVEYSFPRSLGIETTSLNLSQFAPFRERVTPYLVNLPDSRRVAEGVDRFYASRALILQGRIAHFKKEFEKEMSLYEKALSMNSDDHDGRQLMAEASPLLAEKVVHQANSLRSAGRYDAAIGLYRKALRVDPHSSAAYNGLGIAYFGKKDFDRALDAYLNAAKLKPDQLEIHYNLALVYLAKGQNDKATAEIQKVLRLGSHLPHIKRIIEELEEKGYSLR